MLLKRANIVCGLGWRNSCDCANTRSTVLDSRGRFELRHLICIRVRVGGLWFWRLADQWRLRLPPTGVVASPYARQKQEACLHKKVFQYPFETPRIFLTQSC